MTAYKPIQLTSVLRGTSVDLMALMKRIEEWDRNMNAILNRGITVLENMDARIVSVESHATPDTEFSVLHTLGKVPTGYVVCGQDLAGSLYDGSTANTSTTLYLKCDTAEVTFSLLVF